MSNEDPHGFEEDASSLADARDDMRTRFRNGDVVVAKVGRYPYWPAMVDIDPDTSEFCWGPHLDKTTDTTHFNVVFFDGRGKVTRSWVLSSKIEEYARHFPSPLTERDLEHAKSLPAKKKQLIDARMLAEQALRLDVDERTSKYSFIKTYKGKITLFDNDDGTRQILYNNSSDCKPDNQGKKKSPFKVAKGKPPRPRGRRAKSHVNVETRRESDCPIDSPQESSLKLRITKDKHGGRYSSKIAVTDELSEQLSQFATSYPPSPEAEVSPGFSAAAIPTASAPPMPIAAAPSTATAASAVAPASSGDAPGTSGMSSRGMKRKPELSTENPKTSPKKATPAPKPLATTSVSNPTVQKPVEHRKVGIALPVQPIPPGETMANKMSDVIVRMQTSQQLPARLQTKKTVSNVGLVVNQDPTIDLTGDDEPQSTPWEKGEVVFAHLNGFQPWPAVIDGDPRDNGNHLVPPSGGPAELVHVIFLELNKRLWVPVNNVTKFTRRSAAEQSSYSHKFAIALETANKAARLSPPIRISTFGTRSLPSGVFEDEPIVLD